MLPDFIEFHIGDQPEPERMQKVECEALLAIEESEAEKVPPQNISCRPDEWRQTPPRFLEPLRTLIGVPRHGRFHECTPVTSFAPQLFARQELRIDEMLRYPEIDVLFLPVLFDDVVAQPLGAAFHPEMMIEKDARIATYAVLVEQL